MCSKVSLTSVSPLQSYMVIHLHSQEKVSRVNQCLICNEMGLNPSFELYCTKDV